jgi:hypothetical protein
MLIPNAENYDLPTPYNSFGAGVVLMEALQQADVEG